ncbi:RNA polymerase sigma factor [Pullulanibacillus sp. KACC 23026]|uniref:RNA polymerase sigma factor n=1 Tax=Pullulanibacillus sp. KACC 23026 TaxID=3028315 RepID=UPI0023B0D354|nr:RNA polymerase sigma factor [Pullulanibacillus sp. KACC 23026]WEG12415.1 RNA polymerase sigma factor [Pullulanibacillus sp. KACC 23026]
MEDQTISNLFYLYNKDIYHFLVYYTGLSDVEDLVQEVFIRAIKGWDSYEKRSSPKTWLISIARHVGIDEIRKRKRRQFLNQIYLNKEASLIEEQTPDHALDINESNKALYQAIQSLKSSYRDVVILRGIKELSVTETAEVLNWSESKVRITFHRALKALKEKKERLSL